MKDIDMELLNDLIEKCEAKMGQPFKKSKPEPKEEPQEEESEGLAVLLSGDEESEDEHDDTDLQDLIEMYKKLKG